MKWNEYSDTVVRTFEAKRVLKQKPYALFYRRTTADVEQHNDSGKQREISSKFEGVES